MREQRAVFRHQFYGPITARLYSSNYCVCTSDCLSNSLLRGKWYTSSPTGDPSELPRGSPTLSSGVKYSWEWGHVNTVRDFRQNCGSISGAVTKYIFVDDCWEFIEKCNRRRPWITLNFILATGDVSAANVLEIAYSTYVCYTRS